MTRFRLSSLLGLFCILSVGFAYLRAVDVRFQKEQAALSALSGKRFGIKSTRTTPNWATILPSQWANRFSPVTRLSIHGGTIDEEKGYYLHAYEFTDEHVTDVIKLSELRYLSLTRTSITGEGLGRLNNLKRLVSLDLSGVEIGSGVLERFRKSNPQCALCTHCGWVYVSVHPNEEISVDFVPIQHHELKDRLKSSIYAAQLAGYSRTEIRMTFLTNAQGTLPLTIEDRDSDPLIEEVRKLGKALGYSRLYAGTNREEKSIDFSTGVETVHRRRKKRLRANE